jgi:hypothetical protein
MSPKITFTPYPKESLIFSDFPSGVEGKQELNIKLRIFQSRLNYFGSPIPLTLNIVELEGFEPSSKQAARQLSTCLAIVWFSRGYWSMAIL